MFEHWDSFYLLIGGAAGALIGLLFVVATLTQGRDRDSALRGASIYMSPVVLHLALVLVISAAATAPDVGASAAAAMLGAAGLIGAAVAARVVYALSLGKTFSGAHWTDLWCYGAMPLAADLALLASGMAAATAEPATAARAAAVSLVAVLLLAIRNAWDLVTWISATTNAEKNAAAADKPSD